MIPSQLVYPFRFLVERVENEGFLSFDRPPPMPPNQNILLVTAVEGFGDTPGLAVLRAAWWLFSYVTHTRLSAENTKLHLVWASRFQGYSGRDTVAWSSGDTAFSGRPSGLAGFLTSFLDVGAPFFLSMSTGDDPAGPDRRQGEPLPQTLTQHNVNLIKTKQTNTRVFGLYGSALNNGLQHLKEELLALDADVHVLVDVTLAQDENGAQSIALAQREPLAVPADFEGRVTQVSELVKFLISEQDRIWSHG